MQDILCDGVTNDDESGDVATMYRSYSEVTTFYRMLGTQAGSYPIFSQQPRTRKWEIKKCAQREPAGSARKTRMLGWLSGTKRVHASYLVRLCTFCTLELNNNSFVSWKTWQKATTGVQCAGVPWQRFWKQRRRLDIRVSRDKEHM